MARLEFDKVGERFYETGVDRCVLYLQSSTGDYPLGVAWNGITEIQQNPSGAESNKQYADNIDYLNLISKETFGGSIASFTQPDEWAQCDGSVEPVAGIRMGQQARKSFGLSTELLSVMISMVQTMVIRSILSGMQRLLLLRDLMLQ